MSTIKSYVKLVLAQLTGDQNTIVAERNYLTAKATIKGQVAALEAERVKLENAVDDATETLHKAKYPTTKITNGEEYLDNIQNAQASLSHYQGQLDDNTHSIEYFTKLQEEFDKDSE